MANRENGSVSIDIDGKPYRMALTLDAMVAIEEKCNLTFQQVVDKSDSGSMTHTRALIWGALQVNEPPPPISEVSRLVEAAGGIGTFTLTLIKLAKAISPDPKDLEALGIKANPRPAQVVRKAAAGTGVGSTSTPVASA